MSLAGWVILALVAISISATLLFIIWRIWRHEYCNFCGQWAKPVIEDWRVAGVPRHYHFCSRCRHLMGISD
jgi:hypothetical protein